jgi:hypothetical protein
MMFNGIVREDGVLYGPTKSGKTYVSLYYHRQVNRSQDKCIWCILSAEEYALFDEADDKNWQDVNGHYWGLHDLGNTPLGTQDERICKFPRTSNLQDAWHGYPVARSKDTPSDDFINHWIENGIISKKVGRAIQRGKL